jgi:hypothetical protein
MGQKYFGLGKQGGACDLHLSGMQLTSWLETCYLGRDLL